MCSIPTPQQTEVPPRHKLQPSGCSWFSSRHCDGDILHHPEHSLWVALPLRRAHPSFLPAMSQGQLCPRLTALQEPFPTVTTGTVLWVNNSSFHSVYYIMSLFLMVYFLSIGDFWNPRPCRWLTLEMRWALSKQHTAKHLLRMGKQFSEFISHSC